MYRTSLGERVNYALVRVRVKQAKREKKNNFISIHNHLYCEECRHNGSKDKLDASNDVSEKKARKLNRAEDLWSVVKMTIRCSECEKKHKSKTK